LVSRPVERTIADEEHFASRSEASTTIEVRSRITAQLEKILFVDGAEVKKGDVLFQLDDRSYRAESEKAQANLTKADAALKRVEADYSRGKMLREKGAISLEEMNQLTLSLDEAKAVLQVARAALEVAKVDLDRTQISAPISGRIGRTLVDPGNVVGQDKALATIVVSDPLHVYFDVSEVSVLRMRRLVGDVGAKDVKIPVRVRSAADEDFSREAVIDFLDLRLNPATGTLRVRAVMPNPKGELLPGLFVTVKVPLSAPRKALLIPRGAIAKGDGKDYVLVVNDKNLLESKPVRVGRLLDGLQEIEAGVGPHDVVLVARRRDVKAGDEVKPRLEKMLPAQPLKEKPRSSGAVWRAPLPDFPVSGPGLVVTAVYPGANARTVEEVVAAPIAIQLNGLEGVVHRFLVCSDDGEMRLTIAFKTGTDLNKAQVLAQSRIQAAEPTLPDEVRRRGVTIRKRPVFLLAVALLAADDSYDRKSLGRMGQKLREELARVPAVADVTFYGDPAPSPRLSLEFDRARLAALGLTMTDAQRSLEELLERAGQDPEKLAGSVLKTDAAGRVIRVRDVARIVESEGFGALASLDDKPCTTLLVYQSADAHPRDTAQAIRERLRDFEKTLPKSIEWRVIE
jgi:RND family efflux transporter MFP subunit